MTAPIMFEGESFNGRLARWAAEEWIDRLSDVLSETELGEQIALLEHRPAEELAVLAGHIGVPSERLIACAIRPIDELVWRSLNGVQINCFDLERKKRLYSPAGLEIAAYHRSVW